MNEWLPTFRKIPQTPMRDLFRLQFTGRLNWRGRIAESDLPEVAQQKIVDVVKATRLWRLEKAQIANELIAHFQDGQQQGLDVEHLVAEFGETATVAKLMRSAKKRNRSVFWKTLVAGGYAFLAFLVFYAGLAVWFMSGKPNPSVDYFAVVSADARAVPEEQRAWPIYREAWIESDFQGLNIQERVVGQGEGESWNALRPGDEKWPNVVAFVESEESLVKAIRRGGKLSGLGLELKLTQDYLQEDLVAMHGPDNEFPESWIDADDPLLSNSLIGCLLMHVQLMRDMARMLETDVFRMAEAGDAENAAEDLLAMLGFGPQAAETPFLVSSLVGLATDGIAYNTIEEFLSEYPDLLSDQQLKAIAEKMASLSPRELVRYEGEIAFQKDLIQRIYSDDGSGDGRLTDEGLAMLPSLMSLTSNLSQQSSNASDSLAKTVTRVVGPGVALFSGSRKNLEQATQGAMDEWSAAIEVPFYQQEIREPDYFEQLINKHASNDLTAKAFMNMMMPAMDQVSVAGERTEAWRNGALIGVAAHRFRLRHDRFPETADELVPEFLDEIPVDMVTGQLLNYRLQDGKPLIYSVGQDRDDDGGVEATDSDGERLYGHEHFYQNVTQPADGDWILWPFE